MHLLVYHMYHEDSSPALNNILFLSWLFLFFIHIVHIVISEKHKSLSFYNGCRLLLKYLPSPNMLVSQEFVLVGQQFRKSFIIPMVFPWPRTSTALCVLVSMVHLTLLKLVVWPVFHLKALRSFLFHTFFFLSIFNL